MTSIVFDTDILSTFAKTDGIQYLEKLFAKDRVLITPSVYSELKVPKEYGYDFPDQIFNSDKFELVQLNGREIDEFKSKLIEIKTVHSGELETIIIAMNRSYIFSSMDIKALEYAVSQNVEVLHFHTILKALWRFGILTQEEVNEIIDIMEREDNMEIKDRDMIFDSEL
jgi:predicted nucleic acid-binding protein